MKVCPNALRTMEGWVQEKHKRKSAVSLDKHKGSVNVTSDRCSGDRQASSVMASSRIDQSPRLDVTHTARNSEGPTDRQSARPQT